MTIEYVTTKDVKELDKLITSAVSSAKTMRSKIQIAAVAILIHAEKHGDYTKANDLVNGLGHGVNGRALVQWFTKFGGLSVDKNQFSGWNGKEYIRDNFDDAKSTMWWEFKKQNAFAGHNLEQELKRIIKRSLAMKKKVSGMTQEEQEKVNLNVSDATINAILNLCNFEAIIEEDSEDAPSILKEQAA